ncbi:hypothetical protein MSM1_03685 [Mycobacterium sp. SM1]|uniref:hypothetical protein n=1 Tax=Mycobacterium sp. SM1 TaxID=2816243 RepID=UPI001BD027B5|nr:hypothetical protein [Mycobacterium sp. SM1]MBS4727493.1 hypothetical protein [Mycobacterium sp. SM1]
MHSLRPTGTAILVALTVFGASGGTPARASKDDIAISGTYRATSIGDWAKTNEQYHDEVTTTSIWTISSSCTTSQDCTGTVISDQGWSAPLTMHDGAMWYVKRDVPNWETCPDGTSYPGRQTFYFYPVNADGLEQAGSPTLAGKDRTVGPSGACGQNTALAVEMPFRLDKIS